MNENGEPRENNGLSGQRILIKVASGQAAVPIAEQCKLFINNLAGAKVLLARSSGRITVKAVLPERDESLEWEIDPATDLTESLPTIEQTIAARRIALNGKL